MDWLALAPFIAAIGVFLGPVVAQLAASAIKRLENGSLISRNIALRKIDVVEENIARLSADNDRLREEVAQLRQEQHNMLAREHLWRTRELEYRAIFLRLDDDVRMLNEGFRALQATAELKALAEIARELQGHVEQGRKLELVA